MPHTLAEASVYTRLAVGCLAGAVLMGIAANPVYGQNGTTPAREPVNSSSPPAQAQARGFFDEPHVISDGLERAGRLFGGGDGGKAKNGFYPEFGDMITGAGWIAAGPGYRHWLFDDRAYVDTSAAISWRAYKMAQARFELPALANSRLTVGSQVRWHDYTQVTFFGNGPDSLESARSEYRLTASTVAGYAIVQPAEWLSLTGRIGWHSSPDLRAPAGTFKRGNPPTLDIFPTDPAFAVADQPSYVYGQLDLVADTRDAPGHPTRGSVLRAAWSRYDDRNAARFAFNRYEAEAAHFVPLASDNIVLAFHGWLVGTDTKPGHEVPFYLMPALGGNTSLRGYADYRFHDRNLALASAESRFAIFEHVDAAVFIDAGNVAARFGDLNLDKTSYGVGVRVHTRQTTVARLDFGRSREGWQVVFRLNDPMRLSRFTKRHPPVPFTP